MSSFYTVDNIIKEKADYNIIYGERSNGKTTGVLLYALKKHIESNYVSQLALVRRWEKDFQGRNATQMLEGIMAMDIIPKLTKGKYNGYYIYSQKWYLCKYTDGKRVAQEDIPFITCFSIGSEEHYKSTAYPFIKYVLFDEFITRTYYLPDEFIKFQNLLSTLIRVREDVVIFMCGNTINKYNPYITEMGLVNVQKQKPNTIDVYTYGDSELKVAVEYTLTMGKSKKSNKYFAFDNPKLKMITEGGWEMSIYPHLPFKYLPKDVRLKYYIKFMNNILECSIIEKDEHVFTFIHKKTTPIKSVDRIVFENNYYPTFYNRRKINNVFDEVGSLIYSHFKEDKVYYQNNEIGEIVRNYLNWCKKESE